MLKPVRVDLLRLDGGGVTPVAYKTSTPPINRFSITPNLELPCLGTELRAPVSLA